MAKSLNLGTASRFSLLKIEDDDDEENVGGQKPSSQMKKPSHGKQKFAPLGSTSQKPPKKKSGKKSKPTEFESCAKHSDDNEWDEQQQLEEALRISQMTAEEELQRRRELEMEEDEKTKLALEESVKTVSVHNEKSLPKSQAKSADAKKHITGSASPPPPRNYQVKSQTDSSSQDGCNSELVLLVEAIKAEACQLMDASTRCSEIESAEHVLSEFYKRKLEQIAEVAKLQHEEIKVLKEDLAKSKSRTMRVLEVLREAEVREKTDLVIANEKLSKLNVELNQQVANSITELEQARSRIHELENEQKKTKAGR